MPEGRRRAASTSVFTLVLLALPAVVSGLGVVAAPASAQDQDGAGSGTGEIVVDGAVRIEVESGVLLRVDDGIRYHDTLELRPDGPTLVNELPTERYVEGVAEMPSRWAGEALKAQAVAARTYAWYSAELATNDAYDLCATTACQVFRGAETVLDGGERWQAAVEATAGQVLVSEPGTPVLARYFSTSGGRTYANEEVFPSSGPRDHLVAIDDPDDEASPYHRWTVRFTREEFDDVLSRGETLAGAVPVADVERLGAVTDQDADLRVTGTDGTSVEVSAGQLRDFVSRVAPERFPDRFPSMRSDGLRRLPTTLPSTRFEVQVGDDEVVIEGRGWGHGVGMGQYGARGRAERGQDHVEILAAYYNGLTPTVDPDLPDRIRVGMALDDEVAIDADGPMRIVRPDGQVLVERALGSWSASREADGWRLAPPEGTDAPLEVADTRVVSDPDVLRDAVTLETDVNKPVVLHLEVDDDTGQPVVRRELDVAGAGTHAATWRYRDDADEPVAPGTYAVTLAAEDADGASAGQAVTVTVTEDAAAAASGDARSGSDPLPGILVVVLVAALALPIALVLVAVATRKART